MENILHPFPGGTNRNFEAINDVYDHIALNNARNLVNNAYECQFALTKEQHALLQSMIAPRVLKYASKLQNNSHPIAASLTHMAYQRYNKISEQLFKKHQITAIDIGGSYEQSRNKKIHCCTKITNPREHSRYQQALFRSADITDIQLYYNNNVFPICSNGAENCKFKSPYAFSVNANYDIEFKDIIRMFDNHSIMIYDIAMFLPAILIDKQLNLPTDYYKCRAEGDEIIFSLGDHSLNYVHNYKTWRRYLTHTCIKTMNYTIVIEIVDNIRDFCFLRFTRVMNIPAYINRFGTFAKALSTAADIIKTQYYTAEKHKLIRTIPISKVYGDYYLLPDLISYIQGHINQHNLCRKMVLIQREFTDNVMKWALGATDDQYKYNSFYTWARSQSAALTYDPKNLNMTIFHGINVDINEYDNIVQNLFVYCAIRRFRRTQDVAALFKQIKKEANRWPVVRNLIKIYHSFADAMGLQTASILKNNHESCSELEKERCFKIYNILDVKIKPITDITYRMTFNSIRFADNGAMIVNYDDEQNIDPEFEEGEERELTLQENIDNNLVQKYRNGQCAYEAMTTFMRQNDNKLAIKHTYTNTDINNWLRSTKYEITDAVSRAILLSTSVDNSTIKATMDRILNMQLDEKSTWLSDVELGFMAYLNGYNLTINDIAKKEKWMYITKNRTNVMTLNYNKNHWSCERRLIGGYIADEKIEGPVSLDKADTTIDFKVVNNRYGLKAKMSDLLDYIYDNTLIRNSQTMVDISCAPGVLATLALEEGMHVYLYEYQGDNAFKMTNKKLITQKYNDVKTLNVSKNKPNDLYIFDNYAHLLEDAILLKYVNRLITKYDGYDIINFEATEKVLNQFAIKRFFMSEKTKGSSGEIYVYLEKDHTKITERTSYNPTELLVSKEDRDINEHRRIRDDEATNTRSDRQDRLAGHFQDLVRVTSNATLLAEISELHNWEVIKGAPEEFQIKAILGVGGSAKSQRIIKDKINSDYMISPILNDFSETYVTFMNRWQKATLPMKPTSIIIDEAFAMDGRYLAYYAAYAHQNEIEVYLAGDTEQIRPWHNDQIRTKNAVEIMDGSHYIWESKRIIGGAAELLKNKMPDLTTTNGGELILSSNKESLKAFTKEGKDMIICFTQYVKKLLTEQGLRVITAHESQSMTIGKVLVYCGDITDIHREERFRYAYVALSRAKNRLILYGSDSEQSILLTILGSNIEEANKFAQIEQINDTQLIETTTLNYEKEEIEVDRSPINVDMVEQILDKTILKTNNNDRTNIITRLKILPKVEVKCKINIDHISKDYVEVKGVSLSNNNYVKKDFSKDSLATVQTLFTRYGNIKRISSHFEELKQGLSKFINIKALENYKVERTDILRHSVDYLINLQKKLTGEDDHHYANLQELLCERSETLERANLVDEYMVLIDDFINKVDNKRKNVSQLETDWHDKHSSVINFIMKKQDKHILTHGKDADYKAGQGVSAWSKIMNIMFAGYSRALQEMLLKNVKPNVKLAYNESDEQISKFAASYGRYYYDKQYINTDNDFSEMDSSHAESSVKLEMLLYKLVGMPENMLNMYLSMRKRWMMSYMNNDGITKLWNDWLQHSGQPLTLAGNTLLNMAAVGAFIELGEVLYAMFKGDDSHIRSTRSKQKQGIKTTMEKDYGYKFKVCNPQVSEFIAYFVTPHGFYPDVLRRVTKTISKTYENAEQWEESRINIIESIKCVTNNQHLQTGSRMASTHYCSQNIVISSGEIDLIYNYLSQLSKMTYEKLDFTKCREVLINYTKNFHY